MKILLIFLCLIVVILAYFRSRPPEIIRYVVYQYDNKGNTILVLFVNPATVGRNKYPNCTVEISREGK